MKPKKIINRDGGRPKCPHCGKSENKTLNSDRTYFECVNPDCKKTFRIKQSR